MKKEKIIYWSATVIVGATMLYSAYGYLTSPEMKGAFIHLGFPNSFRIELALAKILDVVALVVPFVKGDLKLAAYVGFAITFLSAFIAHTSLGDPMPYPVMPLVFLGLLIVSFVYYKKISNLKTV